MKTALKNISIFLCLILVAACGEDNLDPVGKWSISEAMPTLPANNTSVVLNEGSPTARTRFEWSAASASNRFVIQYKVVLVPQGSENYDTPIVSFVPGNSGKNLFLEVTAEQIDYALWAACYPAGAEVKLTWAIIAWAIDKQTVTTQNISVTRFATEYFPEALFITGTGTEAGSDAANATKMRARTNADGDITNIFDVYTTLNKSGTFEFRDQADSYSKIWGGAADKKLDDCGSAIQPSGTGPTRIVVNLNNNTYDTLRITKWSLVGDAVEGGWGGDVPLAYKGKGVWEAKVNFLSEADFIFRANGNWDYIIKRIPGTAPANNRSGKVFMESEAGDAGITVENVPSAGSGMATVTLNLSSDGYTYAIVYDPVTVVKATLGETGNPNGDKVGGNFTIGQNETPAQLYLVSDGAQVAAFTKDGNTFTTGKYLALLKSKTYIINSAADGSGTTFGNIGDKSISVARDQAYTITVDFAAGKLNWSYYNMKLFHWEPANGWELRQEIPMTYTHPYTFTVTNAALVGGNVSKFNSPWDIQFSTASTALSGTMNNDSSLPNYSGIVQTGTYNATIVVNDMYTQCSYNFVKQ